MIFIVFNVAHQGYNRTEQVLKLFKMVPGMASLSIRGGAENVRNYRNRR